MAPGRLRGGAMVEMEEHHHLPTRQQPQERLAMRLSLLASVLMLVGKGWAAWTTGSDAILSDAGESVVHIVATGLAAFSLWYAAQPPDRQHPYGHSKMAWFSAGFEGALIGAAGVGIVASSVVSLLSGSEVQQLGLGLAVTGGLGLVNLALGLFLQRTGRVHHNMVLEANGKHVLSDMWTSLGVVAGVALVWATGLTWLDPVVAIGAGLHILREGLSLLKTSFDGLMERADEALSEAFLGCLEGAKGDGIISDYHHLRHRAAHQEAWLEVHLLMPGELRLVDAHARATAVEGRLRACVPARHLHVTTHLEPADHDQIHPEGHPPDPLAP